MRESSFNSQQKSVALAAGILAVSALLSRLLGVFRDWLLARTFGAGQELDVYFAAFRVPDFVYHLLIAGGVVVAFLPLFSEYFSKNQEEAWRFTNNTLNVFLFLLIVFSFILFVFARPLVNLIAPGFDPEQLAKTTFLTRLMFLSPLLFGLSSVFSGILQYFNRFFVYGLTPILYNLGIILGIIFLTPSLGVVGPAIGVVFGAFLHFAVQIPSALTCGFKYKPIFDLKDPGIKRVFLLMLPRTMSVAGSQFNLIVITAIASTLAAGSVAVFNFASNLYHVPTGIIGISFAIAVFPPLARDWVNGLKDGFVRNFTNVFRHILYLIVPISFLIFILRNQIVEIIYFYGQFTREAALLTAASLGLFCFGIFAFSLIPLISRAFFSFQDTRTPAIIVFLTVFLSIILSLYFTSVLKTENLFQNFLQDALRLKDIEDIRVLGLPLAFSAASVFQLVLLLIFLYKRIGNFKLREILHSFLKIFLASLIMTLGVYLIIGLVEGALLQIITASLTAVLIYLSLTLLLKSPEIKTIFSAIFRRNN